MKLRFSALIFSVFVLAQAGAPVLPAPLRGQGLNPASLLEPPAGSWPTYNGDYSGRRYSPLTQINSSNVSTMTLAWIWRVSAPGFGAAAQPSLGSSIKATPLEVNGVLYFSEPDNVWAVDARTGEQ
ncbi:MAG TPA: hypothetical protein VMI06_06825, partial [Terriglobia bacterium]|nr:hypothetical protein [Terriglobia bacterium]